MILTERAGSIMGLKMIPDFDSIFLYEKGGVDAWGISTTEGSKVKLSCLIRETETATPIESKGGKMVLPSFDISFNGNVKIHVGDYVEVEGRKMVVLTRKQKKDLSRTVLITKITV